MNGVLAMNIPDVRRLAAVDMHGVAGTLLRRRVILAEFAVGAVAALAVGLLLAVRSGGIGWRVLASGRADTTDDHAPRAGFPNSHRPPRRSRRARGRHHRGS